MVLFYSLYICGTVKDRGEKVRCGSLLSLRALFQCEITLGEVVISPALCGGKAEASWKGRGDIKAM